MVTNETQIEVVDPETNAVEWTGSWSEFITTADDDDYVMSAEEMAAFKSKGIVFLGGGAFAEVCIRIAAVRS